MLNGIDFLSSILKSAQLSQIQIRSILKNSIHSNLRNDLRSLLHEYAAIENEVFFLASRIGWELDEADPLHCLVTALRFRFLLSPRFPDSKVAAMLIKSHSASVSSEIHKLKHLQEKDKPLLILSQKLSDCEISTIHRMKKYL